MTTIFRSKTMELRTEQGEPRAHVVGATPCAALESARLAAEASRRAVLVSARVSEAAGVGSHLHVDDRRALEAPPFGRPSVFGEDDEDRRGGGMTHS